MGAQARRFPSLLTLATDHCPDQHRRQQSQDRPHELRGIWDPCDEFCPDKVYSHFILLSPLGLHVRGQLHTRMHSRDHHAFRVRGRG
jgi:hypothetical protein